MNAPAPHTTDPGPIIRDSGEQILRDAFTLPAHDTQVPRARHHLTMTLTSWAIDPPVRDDAALILTELFTNALLHTDSAQITCHVLSARAVLYLSVTDQGRGLTGPHIPNSHDNPEHGRGLLLVSALAHTWGVAAAPGQGRTVWAVLGQEKDGYGHT